MSQARRSARSDEWRRKIKLYFSPSLVSRFALVSCFEQMPRSPRLAHKAAVMQAKIPLHIYKIRCHWFVRAGRDIYNVQIVTSWKVTDWFISRTHPDKQERQEMISLSEKEPSFKRKQTSEISKGSKTMNKIDFFLTELFRREQMVNDSLLEANLRREVRTPFRQLFSILQSQEQIDILAN